MAFKYFKEEDGVGIIGSGKTLQKAFEEAGKAVFNLIKNINKIKPGKVKIQLECSAESEEELLIEWLNELLREASISGIIFSEIKIESMKSLRIKGWARGIKSKKEIEIEPTYEKLEIGKRNSNYFVQCVVST